MILEPAWEVASEVMHPSGTEISITGSSRETQWRQGQLNSSDKKTNDITASCGRPNLGCRFEPDSHEGSDCHFRT